MFYYLPLKTVMIMMTKTISKVSKMEIQIGERTHTQLHVITPRSFSTINAIVSSPVKPIPPAVVLLLSSIVLSPFHLCTAPALCPYPRIP